MSEIAVSQPLAEARRSRSFGDFLTQVALRLLFVLMDLRLLFDRRYRSLIYRPPGSQFPDDWRARVSLASRDGVIALHALFGGGRVRSGAGCIDRPDAVLMFRDSASARAMLTRSPSEVLEMLLDGTLLFTGNLSHVARLSFMLTGLAPRKGARPPVGPRHEVALPPARRSHRMAALPGARHLPDPAFSDWTIDDFPRLRGFLTDFFSTNPEVCTERPRLYTESMREHGFESDPEGRPVSPELRQATAFRHLMMNRRPIVRDGDLLAGTTTTRDIGVVVYPECGGIPIWPELFTVTTRKMNPYRLSYQDARVLNDEVFPFWMDRNVREVARARGGNPRSLQLDERFALYFQWKTQAISHTIADFPAVLGRGLEAIRSEALAHAETAPEGSKRDLYRAMALSLEGVMAYAANLAAEAKRRADREQDAARRVELEEIARICAKVPARPAETLHEALQSIWITWVACHMENTNAGLSIGRLDQWLQPFFERDIAGLGEAARPAFLKTAMELCGCFYLRCTDHLPQVADLGNKLFGGSSSDQVVTLGGVRPDGSDGVCDMSFVFLKITEMLGLRDPNVNARYHEGVNPPAWLERLCEVNLLTGSTPSIHNDAALIRVLEEQGLLPEHARDWSATGCVEPTSCGRHYGHTNCMMFNLVAPLEMALRDGWHPLLNEQVGPHTGDPRTFTSFEQMLEAYFKQLESLIGLAVHANNLLGEAHREVRPTPLLSALIQGPMEKGVDLVEGGALYNSSGSGNVGIVDVVDSLVAMKQLVFEEKVVEMPALLAALEADFVGHEALLARAERRVPKFGSGHPVPRELAARVIERIHQLFRAQPHYRGGRYNSGFWSMSNHVAFGTLSGALPSGRRKGKAFTPGCTPSAMGRATLAEHLHDVASLDVSKMPNNIAFNVKVVPGPDTPERAVATMAAYARTYIQEGGMQLQFNVLSTETLRDAMAHPEKYPTLMVRISGYNAYFNDLNDDMKRELIERAEHRLGREDAPRRVD